MVFNTTKFEIEKGKMKGRIKPIAVIKRKEEDQYPTFSFGPAKAKLLLNHMAELQAFVDNSATFEAEQQKIWESKLALEKKNRPEMIGDKLPKEVVRAATTPAMSFNF